MTDEVKNIFDSESEAIKRIPVNGVYEKVVDLLHMHVHTKGGKIIVSGMGKAGQVANNIATTFSSTGSPAVFLHPSEAQHGDLGVIRENDVLVVLSNSGKTREILELIDLTHQLYNEIPVVLITGNTESDLLKMADYTLFTGHPKEVCPLGLTPTTSTTVMTVIGDALTVLLLGRLDFNAVDYAKRHHGGYLGEKSRKSGKA